MASAIGGKVGRFLRAHGPLLIAAGLVLGALLVGALYQFRSAQEETLARATLRAPQDGNGVIQVQAWANRGVIRASDSFEIWISIKNTSGLPLANVRFAAFESPGFVPIGNCWVGGMPACRPGVAPSGGPVGLLPVLPPGVTSLVFAELKLSASKVPEHPKRPIEALIAWESGGKADQRSVQLDPIRVAPLAPRWVIITYSLLKDFFLPVLLGVLAFSFQHVLSERARVQAVRNVFLPTATANAVKYLLPIVSAIGGLKRTASREGPEERQGFFYFIFLFKRMRDLLTESGAVVLGNLEGEQFITECWGVVHRRAIDRFGYVDLSYTMDLMVKAETISLFLDQLGSSAEPLVSAQDAAGRVEAKFLEWREGGDKNPDLGLLGVMAEVIQFEANRLYLGWYKEVPVPDQQTLKGWEEVIENLYAVDHDLAQGLFEKLDSYVETLSWRVRWQFKQIQTDGRRSLRRPS